MEISTPSTDSRLGWQASPTVPHPRLCCALPPEGTRYEPAFAALRVMAAFGVVALHVCSLGLRDAGVGTTAWWIANFYDASTRWCVPVFIMISGALLLGPQKALPMAMFYRRRMGRILVPLAFWSVFYLALQAYSGGLTAYVVVRGLIRGNPYGHLWFLYMIAGLYCLTPVLQPFTARASWRQQMWIVALLLASVGSHSFIQTFTASAGRPTIFSVCIPHIPYFLCGYVLSQVVVRSRWIMYLAVWIVAAWVAVAVGTGVLFRQVEFYLSSHHSPLIILMSMGVFLLVSGLFQQQMADHQRPWRILRNLDNTSFGVYLIHPFFLFVLMKSNLHTRYIVPHPLLAIPLLSIALIMASISVASLLKRIPVVRRII